MNKLLLHLITLSMLVGFLAGCKTRKNGKPVRKSTPSVRVDALKLNQEKELKFNTLILKGKGDIDSPQQSLGFTYKICIANDSLIWGSFTKAGYEFIRVLVTQDSVYLRVIPEKRAILCDFEFLSGLTGIKADYQYMQNLLTGEMSNICETLEYAKVAEPDYQYDGKASTANISYTISDQFFKLLKMTLSDERNGFDSQVLYDEFELVDEQLVPHSVNLVVNKDGKTAVGLSHNKIEIDPEKPSFNLRIPKSYEVEYCGEIKKE